MRSSGRLFYLHLPVHDIPGNSSKFAYMGRARHISDRALVNVKVHPALREYILSINSGSDVILPMKHSRLWGLVKMYLEPIPSDYRPVPPEGSEDSIRVALYRTGRPVWSVPEKKVVTVHTLYRDHLSDEGQRAVARHLMHHFKQTFRAYMNGALSNNPDLDISEAIDEFCSDYHIENEKITIEMLRKDWYRFRQRCSNGSPVAVECSDL